MPLLVDGPWPQPYAPLLGSSNRLAAPRPPWNSPSRPPPDRAHRPLPPANHGWDGPNVEMGPALGRKPHMAVEPWPRNQTPWGQPCPPSSGVCGRCSCLFPAPSHGAAHDHVPFPREGPVRSSGPQLAPSAGRAQSVACHPGERGPHRLRSPPGSDVSLTIPRQFGTSGSPNIFHILSINSRVPDRSPNGPTVAAPGLDNPIAVRAQGSVPVRGVVFRSSSPLPCLCLRPLDSTPPAPLEGTTATTPSAPASPPSDAVPAGGPGPRS